MAQLRSSRSSNPDIPIVSFGGRPDGDADTAFWLKQFLESRAVGALDNAAPDGAEPVIRRWWPLGRRSSKLTLEMALLSAASGIVFGVEGGSEVHSVVHNNVVLASGRNGLCDLSLHPNLEQELRLALALALQGRFDDRVGMRIACQTWHGLARDEIRVFTGPGIFAPENEEQPIGWLRYYPDVNNLTDWREPCFPDGTPAGIYRSQSSLCFAIKPGVLPATLELGVDLQQPGLLGVLTQKPPTETTGSGFATLQPAGPYKGKTFGIYPLDTPADKEADQSWRVAYMNTEGPKGRFDLCRDARSSRLHQKPPLERGAMIKAMRLRAEVLPGNVRRLWINLCRDRMLIASGLQAPFLSAIWDADRGVGEVYNWANYSFDSDRFYGLIISQNDGGAIELRRIGGEPLGYLALPEDPALLGFDSVHNRSAEFSIDWLDHTGTVELRDRKLSLAHALASTAEHIKTPPMTGPNRFSANGELELGPFVLDPI